MKKKVIKPNMAFYIVLLGCVLALMMVLRNCGKESNVLITNHSDTIGVSIEYSPLSLYMYNDTMGGFEYDLMRMIAKKGDLPIKFYPSVSLNKSLKGLKDGEYKILIAQFPVTAEYRDNFIFTDPIYLDQQTLIQRQDSLGNTKVKSQLDLGGKTIYVVSNSPMVQRLHSLSKEIGDTIYIKKENEYGPEQLAIMVSKGQIDYAVINNKIAKNLAKDMPNLNIGTKTSFTQFQAWALPKDQVSLRDSINTILKEIKTTPEYKDLYNRYFQ